MSHRNTVTLTPEQTQALVEWADQLFVEHGTTSWGPQFSAAMNVAKSVREQVKKDFLKNE